MFGDVEHEIQAVDTMTDIPISAIGPGSSQCVRLRGFPVTFPEVDGALLLSRMPFSDPHEVDETDVPFDTVAVVGRCGVDIPPVPGRPTPAGFTATAARTGRRPSRGIGRSAP